MRIPFLVAVLPALLLAGCAVGPNYRRPPVTMTEAFRGQEPPEPTSIADLPWWEVFNDEVLQYLIAEALRNNYDLLTAISRVEAARGVLISTRSQMFPQATYEGGASRGRQFIGGEQQITIGNQKLTVGSNRTFNIFLGTLNASWEIDLWGRIRRATESARADLLASNDFRRGVVLSLVSQVAQTYFQLLELELELEIAQRSTKTFSETLDLFQRQFEGGIGTKLAVARGEAALAQAAADIPDTERFIVSTENAICILLGWPPTPIPRGTALTSQELPPRASRRLAGGDPRAPPRRVAGGAGPALGERPDRGRDRRLLPAHRPDRPLRRNEQRAGIGGEGAGQRLADRRIGDRAALPGRQALSVATSRRSPTGRPRSRSTKGPCSTDCARSPTLWSTRRS